MFKKVSILLVVALMVSVCAVPVSAKTTAQKDAKKMYSQFKANKMSKNFSIAMVAVAYEQTGVRPTFKYGAFYWTDHRLRNLKKFAKRNKYRTWKNAYCQANFVAHEIGQKPSQWLVKVPWFPKDRTTYAQANAMSAKKAYKAILKHYLRVSREGYGPAARRATKNIRWVKKAIS